MARFVIGGSWAEYTRHPAIMGDLLNDGDLAITRLRRIIQARSRGVLRGFARTSGFLFVAPRCVDG